MQIVDRIFPSSKTGYWLKILSKFVSVQLIVQGLGFASGILLIRSLDKQEYAYFTIANTMQGMMNVLADSGVSSALSSIGSKIWQNPDRFGQLINTAMQCRRYLGAIAVVVVAPILLWMLLKNGASIGYSSILIVGILLELYCYMTEGVLITVPRLHSQIDRIQRLNLVSVGSRLVLLLSSSFAFLNAAVGIFASTVASGLQNLLLRYWVKETVDFKAPIDREYRQEILKLVKIQVPNGIFYCLQGQITIWLITLFGHTENIAEVGAISRLGAIFSIVGSVITNIVLPSCTRCQSPSLLTKRYFQVIAIYSLLGGFLILLGAIFPAQLLWILGKQYGNLQDEVVLMLLSSIVNAIYVFVYFFNFYKGWIEDTWMLIPAIILTQLISLCLVDISTVKGIIIFGILPFIPMYSINFYISHKNILSLKKVDR